MDPRDVAIWINGVGFGFALLAALEKIAFPLAIRAAHLTRSRHFHR